MKDGSPSSRSQVCTTCQVDKPITEFWRSNRSKTGYYRQCKSCRTESILLSRKKYVALPPPPGFTKPCTTCGQVLPAEKFTKDKKQKYGLTQYCLECRKQKQAEYRANTDPAKRYEYGRKYRKRNLEGWFSKHLLRNYGIVIEDYLILLDAQFHVCGICKELNELADGRIKPLEVDHVHDESRRVRGLLCRRCNSALGQARDDADWLESAARYVRNGE